MRLQENIDRIKQIMEIKTSNDVINETTTNIGPFKTDLDAGSSNHKKRALGNWQSDNAWDLFAPEGTVVKSYTKGKVIKISDSNRKSGKIYGISVTVQGKDGYSDIFYTHLKNVDLKQGDEIEVGDKIGEISEWCTNETCLKKQKGTHVHIGLPYGEYLKDLVNNPELKIDKDEKSKDDETTDDESESFGKKLMKKMLSKVFS